MKNPTKTRTTTSPSSTTTSGKNATTTSKLGLKRGPWTAEEDELLSKCVNKEGEGRWRTLPKRAGLLRCGKSCRLRWMNYLRPSVKRGQIAPDEEDLILRLHGLLGNRWSLIAGRIPGRTDNEIKNYWNTHLSKKLISQGIDPRTHKPFFNPDQSNMNTKASSSSKPCNGKSRYSSKKHVEETTSGSGTQLNNNDNDDNSNKENDKENHHTRLLMSSDGLGMNVNHNQQGPSSNYNEEDEDDLNGCNDDIISLFLNSPINEDPFNTQNHQIPRQQQLTNGPDSTAFGSLCSGWESAIMSFTCNQNDPKRVNDHHHI